MQYKIANQEYIALLRTNLPKLRDFSLFFPRGQRSATRILNFFIFLKNESAIELLNMIFQNTSPVHQKGSFGKIK